MIALAIVCLFFFLLGASTLVVLAWAEIADREVRQQRPRTIHDERAYCRSHHPSVRERR